MKDREITSDEQELINRILSFRSKKLDEKDIFVGERVEEIDMEGSIKFVHDSTPLILQQQKFPVEAQFQDKDGVWVYALLFIVDAKVDELEIYKDDSSPILQMPKPQKWQITD